MSQPQSQVTQIAPAPDSVRHVLVVEDSRLQRRILTRFLKKWGFEVSEAESGDEALELSKARKPDLVLSDWMMPGMDGLEFCKQFRALPSDPYGYFILLTSKNGKGEVSQGLEAGADDFLLKPVAADELRARIAAGERVLEMERELTEKNRLVSDTLEELQKLYRSLDNDLVEAEKLQQSLIRERFHDFGSADLSLLLRSSGRVGGDLVGFYTIGPDRLGLFAIDVSGHGVSSAMMTARLAGYLSSAAPEHNVALTRDASGDYVPLAPAEAIHQINELVLSDMDTDHFFTLILADVDLTTGEVTIGQAGHPHPVIQRACGRIEQDGPGGFPVGLIPGADFSQFKIKLAPGDRLILISDGITECPSPDGQLLGEEGFEQVVREIGHLEGQGFFDALLARLHQYAQSRDFPDDISAILFDFRGPPSEVAPGV